ncbi:hypothetical protein [Pseudomonas sp. G5(2012)]|uniref:hypothetical protein n=1 Tax=Pseudomonas sp. G5(2012) TaxID=1268068 RepID=UPI0005B3E28C|nr:hypothetical protein [Pseudomonas sp. G5(2012)]
MRPKLLVHPSQARTISDPMEQERLLGMGWVLAAPKPRTKDAKRMRSLRQQRRRAGWLSVYLWLSPEQVSAVRALKRSGESYAALLVRLAQERSLL